MSDSPYNLWERYVNRMNNLLIYSFFALCILFVFTYIASIVSFVIILIMEYLTR